MGTDWRLPLKLFAGFVTWYHVSEYGLVRAFNPETLSIHSLLISKPYLAAMAISMAEYFLSWCRFAKPKRRLVAQLLPLGVVVTLFGELLRKAAWLTARRAFTHKIQTRRRQNHRLVTSGVYRWSRHPGYVGWAAWSVGTQLILGNPVCSILFAAVTWDFFKVRIPFEDQTLESLFGEEYLHYRSKTPTRIPFIP